MSPHPPLNGGQIGFYTAVATVIPVLTLAYVVQGRAVAATMIFRAHNRDRWKAMVEENYEKPPNAVETWLKALDLLNSSDDQTWRQYIWSLAVFIVIVVLVVLPAAGEIASLQALLANHASSNQRHMAWSGLLASGAVVIGPMVYSAFGLDELQRTLRLRRELRTVAAEFAAGQIDEAEWERRLRMLDKEAGWSITDWARREVARLTHRDDEHPEDDKEPKR